jgi:uncharacterized protein (TIGR02246 family)
MENQDHSRGAEQEILELEKQYWQAMKDNDVTAALQLTDFPCIVSGPQGVGRIDEQTFMSMMSNPSYSIQNVELKDAQVRMLSDDVAIVAYKAHEELTVAGRPVTLDVTDSSTWIRRDGRWLCALHTESILGDPFGRDRSRGKA